jgi:hypothetical protein
MNKVLFTAGAISIVLLPCLHAIAPVPRRATITGGGNGGGKCTLEVNVDGAAEVEIWGDAAELRTLSGQAAVWRRFQCTAPMPQFPADFRFVGVDGRGHVALLRDPRSNRGRAVVHIDDPKGGREGYTFDLQWRGSTGPDWTPPPPPGRGPWPGFPPARAIQACQDAVTDRLNQFGFPTVAFGRSVPENNPSRNGWVTGTVTGRRRSGSALFSFSCSVDFDFGRVRSVDVQRQ